MTKNEIFCKKVPNNYLPRYKLSIYYFRHMGAQVSKIKHLKMDTWEDAQV